MDGLGGGDTIPFVPLLGDHHGRLSRRLPDDHAGLLGNGDPFQLKITAEDGDLEGHPAQVFRWRSIPATEATFSRRGNLSVNSSPGSLYGSGVE